jgi:outer membrane lipoprotein SlyB
MKTMTVGFVLIAFTLLPMGCVATSTSSREIGSGYAAAGPTYREGYVESIREVVQRTQGDPAGGAFFGSIAGAIIGQAITGTGGGALVGALGGAATGAAASQGGSERRTYEVLVRFDDGSPGRIAYGSPPPWHRGDRVRQTTRGLEWIGGARPAQQAPHGSPPSAPPPPPPAEPPPPPSG